MLVPYFGIMTIGAAAQQLPANIPQHVAKLYVQLMPGATKVAKIGESAAMTSDTTTPGTFIAPNADATLPGGDWSLETQNERNGIDQKRYWFHGANAGDKVGFEVQVNV